MHACRHVYACSRSCCTRAQDERVAGRTAMKITQLIATAPGCPSRAYAWDSDKKVRAAVCAVKDMRTASGRYLGWESQFAVHFVEGDL